MQGWWLEVLDGLTAAGVRTLKVFLPPPAPHEEEAALQCLITLLSAAQSRWQGARRPGAAALEQVLARAMRSDAVAPSSTSNNETLLRLLEAAFPCAELQVLLVRGDFRTGALSGLLQGAISVLGLRVREVGGAS